VAIWFRISHWSGARCEQPGQSQRGAAAGTGALLDPCCTSDDVYANWDNRHCHDRHRDSCQFSRPWTDASFALRSGSRAGPGDPPSDHPSAGAQRFLVAVLVGGGLPKCRPDPHRRVKPKVRKSISISMGQYADRWRISEKRVWFYNLGSVLFVGYQRNQRSA
jgi:hypothetical protein